MKFLSRRESRRRVAIGRKEWIQVLDRSGILSTKRVETTTQVLLSLIVKEPRICATEILRNNRARAKLLRKRSRRSPRWKKPSASNSKRKPVDRIVARRVTKNTARTGFERSSRETRWDTGAPLLEQALLFAIGRRSTVARTVFSKFQRSKHREEIIQFLCTTMRE